jgi:hypothetical protein
MSGMWCDEMKRWLARIRVFLVLGAIVNVAVAWGCASLSPVGEPTTTPVARGGTRELWLEQNHLLLRNRYARLNSIERTAVGGFGFEMALTEYLFEVPPGCLYPVVVVADVCVACGWPIESLKSDASYDITEDWDGTVAQGKWPLYPIWPGFAINTVFYAGVLWLLFAGPFALRRRRRIRRGLCPKCAYPVGTSDVCTECGARKVAPKA